MATAPNPTSRPFISHIRLRAVTSEIVGRPTVTLDYLDRHGSLIADSVTDVEALEAHARDCLAIAAAVRGMATGNVIPLHSRSALMPEICVAPLADPFDAFLATCFERRTQGNAAASRIAKAYAAWAADHDTAKPLRAISIARCMADRGFAKAFHPTIGAYYPQLGLTEAGSALLTRKGDAA